MADEKQRDPFTLFDITHEIKAVLRDIEDADIAGDADEVEALHAELEALYDTRDSKHEGYVHVIKNSVASAEGHQAVSDEFGARARALTNLAKRLKERLLDDMEQHDESVVNAGIFKIARQRNSQPSLVLSIEAEELPSEYQKVTVEADNPVLKEALKAGEKIDGAELEDGEHIRIRVK